MIGSSCSDCFLLFRYSSFCINFFCESIRTDETSDPRVTQH